MKSSLRVTDPAEISKVVERVHDCWLDAASIQFDSVASTVSIRYLKGTKPSSPFVNRIRFPAAECFLKISGATSLSVQDKEKIRFYDINTVTYDPASMCVEVRTGIPIGIQVVVNTLDISIEETGNVVSYGGGVEPAKFQND